MPNTKVCLQAFFRREERYEGLQIIFDQDDELKQKILDAIETIKQETKLSPKIFENASDNHKEKRAIYIEFHDSYDREGDLFFDKLLKKLDIEHCG